MSSVDCGMFDIALGSVVWLLAVAFSVVADISLVTMTRWFVDGNIFRLEAIERGFDA